MINRVLRSALLGAVVASLAVVVVALGSTETISAGGGGLIGPWGVIAFVPRETAVLGAIVTAGLTATVLTVSVARRPARAFWIAFAIVALLIVVVAVVAAGDVHLMTNPPLWRIVGIELGRSPLAWALVAFGLMAGWRSRSSGSTLQADDLPIDRRHGGE